MTATILVVGLAVAIGLMAAQSWAITRSPFPGLRAIEALAASLPFFVVLFSATYFLLAQGSSSNFTEPLTRTDALYFTVTVFATVGFGDIAAKSEPTRLIVTAQMVADLIILGIGLKIILGAVKLGRELRGDRAPSCLRHRERDREHVYG